MDIGAIGAQYLEQNRYGVENLPAVRGRPEPSFADYLERTGGETDGKAPTETPTEALTPVLGPGKPLVDKTSKLYEQCQELETFLVKNLLTGMRSTIQKTGLIDEGLAGKFYEDMLWDEYAKDFTRNAGFGLAEQAYLELSGQRGRRARY
ncbi:MAG: rod-binding protein [Treponema sp.]|nr:rod-binding protein [Treponema sp.]